MGFEFPNRPHPYKHTTREWFTRSNVAYCLTSIGTWYNSLSPNHTPQCLRWGGECRFSEKLTFQMKIFPRKKYIFFYNIFFSFNIAQALQNAGLVMRIDHWVMEVDPSQVGRISKNTGNPEIPCYSLSTLSYKHQYPCPDRVKKKVCTGFLQRVLVS